MAVTGRRSAIRYEISDSCRISFSVSFAKACPTLDAPVRRRSAYPVMRRSLRQFGRVMSRGAADTDARRADAPRPDRRSPGPPRGPRAAARPRGLRGRRHRGHRRRGPRADRARSSPMLSLVDIGLGEESGIELTRAAARRRRRAPRRALHGLERRRAAGQRAGLRRARLRAQGGHAERADRRAGDRRRRRHLRRPAPAPRAALAPARTQRMPSLSKREREIMDLLAQGLTGEEVAERLVPLQRDRQDAHPQRDDQARGRNRVHADRDRPARGLHLAPSGSRRRRS